LRFGAFHAEGFQAVPVISSVTTFNAATPGCAPTKEKLLWNDLPGTLRQTSNASLTF